MFIELAHPTFRTPDAARRQRRNADPLADLRCACGLTTAITSGWRSPWIASKRTMAAAGWQTLTNDLAVLGETPVLKTTPTMSGPKQLPVHDGGDEQAVSVSSPDVARTPDATQLTAVRGTLMTTPFAAAPAMPDMPDCRSVAVWPTLLACDFERPPRWYLGIHFRRASRTLAVNERTAVATRSDHPRWPAAVAQGHPSKRDTRGHDPAGTVQASQRHLDRGMRPGLRPAARDPQYQGLQGLRRTWRAELDHPGRLIARGTNNAPYRTRNQAQSGP